MGLFFKNAKISEIHGNAINVGNRWVAAMYHPAAALHQRKLLEVIQKDFDKLPDLVDKVTHGTGKTAPENEAAEKISPPSPPEEKPSQLSLF